MYRQQPHQEQFGYLTIAQNTNECDYVRMAYLQAMSVKLAMPGSKYAVVTNDIVPDEYYEAFDYVIPLENPAPWAQANEWQVFYLTPFKETVKLEADLVFTRDCKHWINAFRLKDIVLSQHCRNMFGEVVTNSAHRTVFVNNHLPDVYNGLMYFRFSQTSAEFFKIAESLFNNWDSVKTALRQCDDPLPTTDIIYALTAQIIGPENCTLPLDFINFVHMKNTINKLPESNTWDNMCMIEVDAPMIRINNLNQYHPVHYHSKELITDEFIERYRSNYRSLCVTS